MSIPCIPSNPDIIGIGVRTAIYAQNLLSFVPATFALLDGKVTPTELETLETQSTTILITAFALLVSTIVQACTGGVTNFDAAVILHLSWMNNTNLFTYFLLYFHHRAGLWIATPPSGRQSVTHEKASDKSSVLDERQPIRFTWADEIKKASRNPVFVIGSLHLSLMAAVGIWLWSHPISFGSSRQCTLSASVVIFGRQVHLGSRGLRNWSILVYSVLLTPMLNLVIPIALFLTPHVLYTRFSTDKSVHMAGVRPIVVGLTGLMFVNIVLLADIELALKKNIAFLGHDPAPWTFGQTLALLLLLVPLHDLFETILERRPKRLGDRLLVASKEGQLDVVKWLLHLGPVPRAKDHSLKAAVKLGFADIVECLIDKGANMHLKDHWGQTVLHIAAANGHTDVVKVLVSHNADITLQDTAGQTAVDLALEKGHKGTIIALLGGNPIDYSDQILLHWAAEHGPALLAKQLIDFAYADVHAKDAKGKTALHLAAESGCTKVILCLVLYGARVDDREKTKQTPLGAAAAKGHTEAVKCLIGHGADVNAQDEYGWTPLYMPARDGHTETIRCLLEHGADASTKDIWGRGPLQLAAEKGHTETVKCLLEYGVDVNAEDNDRRTALHNTATRGHAGTVQCLIEHGLDINIKDDAGHTALDYAQQYNHTEVIDLLLESEKKEEEAQPGDNKT